LKFQAIAEKLRKIVEDTFFHTLYVNYFETLKTRDWKRRDWKTQDLKSMEALQFLKAEATEQRSRQYTAAWTHPQTQMVTIRLMILMPAQKPSSRLMILRLKILTFALRCVL